MTRTPQDTFLSDQGLAAARDLAADGKTVVIFPDAPDGEQCSWCDCPDFEHTDQAYQCPACPAPAAAVLRIFDGTPVRRDIPVCDRHQLEAIRFISLVVQPRHSGLPQEPRQ